MKRIFLSAFALALGGALPAAAQGVGPSFACSEASARAERTICDSRRLSRLDLELTDIYASLRRELRGRERRALRDEQRDWIQKRNDCGRDRQCLRQLYRTRIGDLRRLQSGGDDNFQATASPSFDCSSADRRAEQAICRSDRLAQLDRELATLYDEVRAGIRTSRTRRELASDQRDWLRDRNDCERNRRCIREKYQERIANLEAVKARLVPDYQRTELWRARCVDPINSAFRTTCANEDLWGLRERLVERYNDVLQRVNRRQRDRIYADQEDWNAQFNRCGRNIRCQLGKYEERIALLGDRNYLRGPRRTRREDWQRTSRWDEFCIGDTATGGFVTLCANRDLFRIFEDSVVTYRGLLNDYDDRGQRELRGEQTRFQQRVARCGDNVRCLQRLFDNRRARLEERRRNRRGVRRPQPQDDFGARNWQQTDLWQRICTRNRDVAHRTACTRRQLWNLRADVTRAYRGAADRSRGNNAKRRLTNDQALWRRQFGQCGSDRGCLRDKMQRRIATLDTWGAPRALNNGRSTRDGGIRSRNSDPYRANDNTQ
ncbi:MAG: lysozyme inhibitor LprI family protein [Pseudomonadota bacterium]